MRIKELLAVLITTIAITGCASSATKVSLQEPTLPNDRQLRLASLSFEELCIGYIAPVEDQPDPGDILHIKPVDGILTSKYGPRKLNAAKKAKLHKGIDLSAKRGTEVKASGEGKIMFTGNINGYGKVVDISHGEGLVTRYAHLDSFAVKAGQNVNAGDPIGTLGRSGRTTGPNLHFEVRLEDKPVNPNEILKWPEVTKAPSAG